MPMHLPIGWLYIFRYRFFLDLLHLRCKRQTTNSTRVSTTQSPVESVAFSLFHSSYLLSSFIAILPQWTHFWLRVLSELVINISLLHLFTWFFISLLSYLLLSYKFYVNVKGRERTLTFCPAVGCCRCMTFSVTTWAWMDGGKTLQIFTFVSYLSSFSIDHYSLWLLKRTRELLMYM